MRSKKERNETISITESKDSGLNCVLFNQLLKSKTKQYLTIN